MLGLGVDTWQLYSRDDPYYEHWLIQVIDKLTRAVQAAQARPNG